MSKEILKFGRNTHCHEDRVNLLQFRLSIGSFRLGKPLNFLIIRGGLIRYSTYYTFASIFQRKSRSIVLPSQSRRFPNYPYLKTALDKFRSTLAIPNNRFPQLTINKIKLLVSSNLLLLPPTSQNPVFTMTSSQPRVQPI